MFGDADLPGGFEDGTPFGDVGFDLSLEMSCPGG